MDPTLRMYVVINTSLKMSKGKIASQACHAAVSMVRFLEKNWAFASVYKEWRKSGEAIIILGANEQEMKTLGTESEFTVNDAGLTEVESGALTAIGFLPSRKNLLPERVQELSCL